MGEGNEPEPGLANRRWVGRDLRARRRLQPTPSDKRNRPLLTTSTGPEKPQRGFRYQPRVARSATLGLPIIMTSLPPSHGGRRRIRTGPGKPTVGRARSPSAPPPATAAFEQTKPPPANHRINGVIICSTTRLVRLTHWHLKQDRQNVAEDRRNNRLPIIC